ncbi:MAG: hypothetical protein JWR26_3013 [Pedosphaera sp.]|nr:hypothetical protein [Pedosphaera sp.]
MGIDIAIPGRSLLFEPVQDGYGTRVALVFGNESIGGICPYYGRQCYHCDIGAGEGTPFSTDLNSRRLAFFRQHYSMVLPRAAHLVLYNSGSVLNSHELSDPTLQTILEFTAGLAECRVVSLDSREAFITTGRLDFVLQHLRADQQPRPILGLETQDDEARLTVLNKKILRPNVEAVFRNVGHYKGRVGMDINIVFAPPPFRDRQAVAEAEATARYVLELANRHGVPVDFNLHPYYPSRIGRERFPGHPRADLAAALDTAQSIRTLADRSNVASKVFIGWQDEEHDQEPSFRAAELSRYRELFSRFNAP